VAHRQVVLTLPEVVENMRSWQHSGFSVDQSVFLPAGDQQGIERLVRYMTRCPFSLSRLVKVTDTGQVVYKAEKQACRAFPDPRSRGLESGRAPSRSDGRRKFQILSRLDFLAEFTQHIPPKGAHLIRYPLIEKILRGHRRAARVGGLWRHSRARPPPDVEGLVHDLDGCFSGSPTGSSDQAGELTFVDIDTFLATF